MSAERSWVEINLDHFRSNLHQLISFLLPYQEFIQIVKADAYGHGAVEIAQIALEEGAVYLGVANADEGKLLRLQGIKAPILILSPSLIEEVTDICEHNLTPTLSDWTFVQALQNKAKELKLKLKVHVKVDTGMHRSGFRCEEFPTIYKKMLALTNLEIEGIFSHYAASEENEEFSEEQTQIFHSILKEINPKPTYIHLANSSAIFKHNSFHTNLVRIGILSYGVYTSADQRRIKLPSSVWNMETLSLKPVMTFKSIIVQIKPFKKGESIGYNRTYIAEYDGRYGIVPVGYADGYDYLLGNRGIVMVQGRICRVLGKVSMDMLTIDLTSIPKVSIGDEVILMGGETNLLRVEQLVSTFKGSAYELLCQIGRRARRHYYKDGKLVSSAPVLRREFVSTDYEDKKLSRIISSAISQRLGDEELAALVYREVLRGLFYNKDNDITYRKAFQHTIEFIHNITHPEYYTVSTSLTFRKKLQHDYFYVVCANSDELLTKYFQRKDVEYRWLMNTGFNLNPGHFAVTKVMIDNISLDTELTEKEGCLEIICSSAHLIKFVGKEVLFSIQTHTLYPKSSHQVSIFITELTKGVHITFIYPDTIQSVEPITVFSGKSKFPIVYQEKGKVEIKTAPDEWVFPNSGVVIAY